MDTAANKSTVHAFAAKVLKDDVVLFLILVILIVVMSSISDLFLTRYNLLNMTRNFIEIGIVALAMTLVILTGGIDLSVGSLVGMNAMLLGVLTIQSGVSIWVAMVIVLLVSAAAGSLNGMVVTRIGVPPLVVTLATMSMFRGLAYSISDARTFSGFPNEFFMLGQGTVFGTDIPVQLPIFIIFAAVFYIIMSFTKFGRHVMVIGNNERCAVFSGINVSRTKLTLYVLSGFLCGIASIIMVSRLSAARADLGTGFELNVITAVLVGGTSITGGKGSMTGTILGFVLIMVLRNGLSLGGYSTVVQTISVGVVLILSVYLRTLRSGKKQ